MTPKTDLYDLIKSLSKNEKGYFKRFCARQEGEKKYLLLFDFIEKQKEYDEAAVIKEFKGEKFTNNFSVAKAYLYDSILDSLRNYHSELSSEVRLAELFHSLQILFDKGLFKQCKELLKKVLKVANAHEKYVYLIYYYAWQLKLHNISGFKELSRSKLNEIISKQKGALDKLNVEINHSLLGNELMFLLGKEGELVHSNLGEQITKLVSEQDLNKSYGENTTRLKISQGMIRLYDSYYARQDLKRSISDIKNCLSLFESKKELIAEELSTYIIINANMLVIASRKGYYEDFFRSLNLLKDLHKVKGVKLTEKQKATIFSHCTISELGYYIKQAEFEKIDLLIDEIIVNMETYHDFLSEINYRIIVVNVGLMFYGNGNNKQALRWLNRLINIENIKLRPDIIAVAKVLSTLIHFEEKNFDILPSLIRSTKRFLKTNQLLTPLEPEILDYCQWVCKKPTKKADIKAKAEHLLEKITEKDFLKNINQSLLYFDFPVWLRSQISGKHYTDELRAKLKAKKK